MFSGTGVSRRSLSTLASFPTHSTLYNSLSRCHRERVRKLQVTINLIVEDKNYFYFLQGALKDPQNYLEPPYCWSGRISLHGIYFSSKYMDIRKRSVLKMNTVALPAVQPLTPLSKTGLPYSGQKKENTPSKDDNSAEILTSSAIVVTYCTLLPDLNREKMLYKHKYLPSI